MYTGVVAFSLSSLLADRRWLEAVETLGPDSLSRIGLAADRLSFQLGLPSKLEIQAYSVGSVLLAETAEGLACGFQMVLSSAGRPAASAKVFRTVVGVKIDGVTGNLCGQGVGQWVCIEIVTPDGIAGVWIGCPT